MAFSSTGSSSTATARPSPSPSNRRVSSRWSPTWPRHMRYYDEPGAVDGRVSGRPGELTVGFEAGAWGQGRAAASGPGGSSGAKPGVGLLDRPSHSGWLAGRLASLEGLRVAGQQWFPSGQHDAPKRAT